jgi:hypothetical protein
MFAGAMTWLWVFPGGVLDIDTGSRRPGEIREGWLDGPGGRGTAAVSTPSSVPNNAAVAEVVE